MSDQDSPDSAEGNDSPGQEQDGSDIAARVNGLMGTLGKRTQERDEARAALAALQEQLAALQTEDDEPVPVRVDPNRPRKQTTYSSDGLVSAQTKIAEGKPMSELTEGELQALIAAGVAREEAPARPRTLLGVRVG